MIIWFFTIKDYTYIIGIFNKSDRFSPIFYNTKERVPGITYKIFSSSKKRHSTDDADI